MRQLALSNLLIRDYRKIPGCRKSPRKTHSEHTLHWLNLVTSRLSKPIINFAPWFQVKLMSTKSRTRKNLGKRVLKNNQTPMQFICLILSRHPLPNTLRSKNKILISHHSSSMHPILSILFQVISLMPKKENKRNQLHQEINKLNNKLNSHKLPNNKSKKKERKKNLSKDNKILHPRRIKMELKKMLIISIKKISN